VPGGISGDQPGWLKATCHRIAPDTGDESSAVDELPAVALI
jgi:hypothetical protein